MIKKSLQFSSIGLAVEKPELAVQNADRRPPSYVEFRFILNFPSVSLKMKIQQEDILKLTCGEILTLFELKPVKNTKYFLINTRSINIDCVYYKEKLGDPSTKMIQMVTSQIGDNPPSSPTLPSDFANRKACEGEDASLFKFCFETNPPKYHNAEFSIRTSIHSLEINYEKTAIVELQRFFRSDFMAEEVRRMGDAWSKAGVSFAVENHKQFHLDAKLSSPYFIIPSKGTCVEPGGDLIIIYLGTTKIDSQLQEKRQGYMPQDINELEKMFYDKLDLVVNDVQVVFMNSTLDWRSYMKQKKHSNFEHHLLKPISTKNSVYLSINPKYRKLPTVKIAADCPSIYLMLSDKRIIQLFEFFKNLQLPKLPENELKPSAPTGPTITTRTNATSATSATALAARAALANRVQSMRKTKQPIGTIEPDDAWEGAFRLPTDINGQPIPNYPKVSFTFEIKDFSIEMKASSGRSSTEKEYLKLTLDTITLNLAVTKYGLCIKSALNDLQLIDKVILDSDGNHTKILSSASDTAFIKFYFRIVEKEAPNFASLYNSTLTAIKFDFNAIQVVCERRAVINLLGYVKGITDKMDLSQNNPNQAMSPEEYPRKSRVEKLPDKPHATIQTLSENDMLEDVREFSLVANMENFTWKMYNETTNFGDMSINGLNVQYDLEGAKTAIEVQLRDIQINYCGERRQVNKSASFNKAFKQIISCTSSIDARRTDFVKLNMNFYDVHKIPATHYKPDTFKDLISLRLGQIQVICLLKFVNELADFFEPIVNPLPELTEQVRESALEAVKTKYQESEGRKVYLDVQIDAPQLIVPQSSHSKYAFLVDLGRLNINNEHVRIDRGLVTYSLENIRIKLSNVEVKRVVYKTEELSATLKEQVVEKINLSAVVQRLIGGDSVIDQPDIAIKAIIEQLYLNVSTKTAKLLFAILNENLNEGIQPNKAPTSAGATSQLENTMSTSVNNSKSVRRSSVDDERSLATRNSNDPYGKASTKSVMEIRVDLNQIKLMILEETQKNTNTSINLLDNTGSSVFGSSTTKYEPFSDFGIDKINFLYDKKETGTWKATLKIAGLNLDDMRKLSNLAVKRMFVPLRDCDLIYVKYRVDRSGNASLKFGMNELRVNLCLPYILKLYGMVMEALNTGPAAPDAQPQPPNNPKAKNRADNKTIKTLAPIDEIVTVDVASSPATRLEVEGDLCFPEIILFAEPEKRDSKVLLMSTKIDLRYRSLVERTELNLQLTELTMRLGEFSKPKVKGVEFLAPCDINIDMILAKSQKIPLYKVKVKALALFLTPTLYKVVMGVVNTINMSGTEKKIEEIKQIQNARGFIPFKVYDVDEGRAEADAKSIDDELEASDAHAPAEVPSAGTVIDEDVPRHVIEALELTVDEFIVHFCEESFMDVQMLAVLRFNINAFVANWSRNLHLKSNIKVEAVYYNDILSMWEQLIENVMKREDEYRPWMINLWFAQEPGSVLLTPTNGKKIDFISFPPKELDQTGYFVEHPPEKEGTEVPEATPTPPPMGLANQDTLSSLKSLDGVNKSRKIANFVKIESIDVLNLNMTPSAYKVIMYLTKLTTGVEKEAVVEDKAKPLLKLCNFLGLNVTIFMDEAHKIDKGLISNYKVDFRQDNVTARRIRNLERHETIEEAPPDVVPGSNCATASLVQVQTEKEADSCKYKMILACEGFQNKVISFKTDGCFLVSLKAKSGAEARNGVDLERMKLNRENTVIMYRVKTNYGRQSIVFSSPLQIVNNSRSTLFVVIRLHERDLVEPWPNETRVFDRIVVDDLIVEEEGEPLNEPKVTLGVLFKLKPGDVYYVPISYAYSKTLYVTPKLDEYRPDKLYRRVDFDRFLKMNQFMDLTMKKLEKDGRRRSVDASGQDFYLLKQVLVNVDKSKQDFINFNDVNYKIVLTNPVILFNVLPFKIRLDVISPGHDDKLEVQPGQSLTIHICKAHLTNCNIHVSNYWGVNWVGRLDVKSLMADAENEHERESERSVIDLSIAPSSEPVQKLMKYLHIHVNVKKPNEITLFSPYWIINKTGQHLHIRVSFFEYFETFLKDFLVFLGDQVENGL